MHHALPPVDLAAAADRRDQRLAQLAGRLARAARAGAADDDDAALALAAALLTIAGDEPTTADMLPRAASLIPASPAA